MLGKHEIQTPKRNLYIHFTHEKYDKEAILRTNLPPMFKQSNGTSNKDKIQEEKPSHLIKTHYSLITNQLNFLQFT